VWFLKVLPLNRVVVHYYHCWSWRHIIIKESTPLCIHRERTSTPPCIYIVVRVSVATLEMSERSGNPSTLTQVTRTKPTSEKKKRDHQSSVCTEVVEEIKSGSRPLWQYCLASSPVVRRRASQKQKRIVFECCFEGANTR